MRLTCVKNCAMPYELLTALAGFAFVSSITPGPNNLMLMASGANFGFARTLPHMIGVGFGFLLMIVLVGLGLAQVFELYPVSHTVLKIASVMYLLYLAFKIATAAPKTKADATGVPMTFLQACAFQWVNPKAWTMAVTAVTVYASGTSFGALLLVTAVFGAFNVPCITAWTLLGQQMARVLTNPSRLRAFNWSMAALLVASLYPVLLPQ